MVSLGYRHLFRKHTEFQRGSTYYCFHESTSYSIHQYLLPNTLLEYHSDKKEAIVQVDDTNNRFLYDEVTLILTGPAGEYKIDSSMVGEKIKFSYFHSTPTDKPTLEIYLIDKLEK